MSNERRIILFRHGKSDWDADYNGDHERPLKKRGKSAARAMGRILRKTLAPDIVITSSAVRARRTTELAAEAGGWKATIEVNERLYGASPLVVLQVVSELPADCETVVVVGHEPGWSGVVLLLTGGRVRFPTAAMACVLVPIGSWSSVEPGAGELEWLATPRMIEAVGG